MNAHRLFNSRLTIHDSRRDNIESWRLAWGKVDRLTGAIWQDHRLFSSTVGITHLNFELVSQMLRSRFVV